MPVSLVVHADPPSPRRRAASSPSWRLLHAEADRLFPQLRTTWATLFADMQDALPEQALREALATGNALAVEALLMPLWQQVGVQQAQAILPVLIRETVTRAAEAMIPSTQAMLRATVEIAFNVIVPETLAAIDAFIGTQITGISDVTLQNVRAVLRQGFTEGRSLTQMMRDLKSHIGLTSRQTRAVEALRERLTAQGMSRASVQVQVEAAAKKALRLRVESIARSEAMQASNMGNYELMRQSIQSGLLDPVRVKRFWLTAGARACPNICAPIPGMNVDGVGPFEMFDTPAGPLLHPIAHPQCRCTTTLKIGDL